MPPKQGRFPIATRGTHCTPMAYLSVDEENLLKQIRRLFGAAEGIKQRLRSLSDEPETRVEKEELLVELERLRTARNDWSAMLHSANQAKHIGLGHTAS